MMEVYKSATRLLFPVRPRSNPRNVPERLFKKKKTTAFPPNAILSSPSSTVDDIRQADQASAWSGLRRRYRSSPPLQRRDAALR